MTEPALKHELCKPHVVIPCICVWLCTKLDASSYWLHASSVQL